MILPYHPFFQRSLRVNQPVTLFRLYFAQGYSGLFGHNGKQIRTLQLGPFLLSKLSQLFENLRQIVDPLLNRRNFIEFRIGIQLGQQDATDLINYLIVEPLQFGHQRFRLLRFGAFGQLGQLRLELSHILRRHIVHGLDQCHRPVDQIER